MKLEGVRLGGAHCCQVVGGQDVEYDAETTTYIVYLKTWVVVVAMCVSLE